ncbi:unnamed protein product [Lampetra planeri]
MKAGGSLARPVAGRVGASCVEGRGGAGNGCENDIDRVWRFGSDSESPVETKAEPGLAGGERMMETPRRLSRAQGFGGAPWDTHPPAAARPCRGTMKRSWRRRRQAKGRERTTDCTQRGARLSLSPCCEALRFLLHHQPASHMLLLLLNLMVLMVLLIVLLIVMLLLPLMVLTLLIVMRDSLDQSRSKLHESSRTAGGRAGAWLTRPRSDRDMSWIPGAARGGTARRDRSSRAPLWLPLLLLLLLTPWALGVGGSRVAQLQQQPQRGDGAVLTGPTSTKPLHSRLSLQLYCGGVT